MEKVLMLGKVEGKREKVDEDQQQGRWIQLQ